MTAAEVPPQLRRLWRLATGSGRGRPAELDAERVVRAAVELADHEGLPAVTLSKVARTLGVTTMALYRHVGSKDELYVLMGDLATGTPPEVTGAADWRDGLRRWAYALRARYLAHPWLAVLPVSGPPSGPNGVGWLDAGLRALRDTALDWGAKVGAVTVLSGFVRGASQLRQELAEGRRGTGMSQADAEQAYGRALVGLVDAERFPEAARLFASDLFETMPDQVGESDDPDFTFGLELVLDGVAAAVARA